MANQLGFLINLQKCIGCHGCEFACKNENKLGEFKYRRIIKLRQQENVFAFLSMACNHCSSPQCIKVCPHKCYKKNRKGIVVHDPTHCDGCQSCIGSCPFRVPKINPLTDKVNKCNFCINRINKGLQPACVSACIPEALQVINLSQPLPSHFMETLPYFPYLQLTEPSVRFILPRLTKCFWRNIEEE